MITKQKKLLKLLIVSQQPIAASKLAKQLEVSVRTIRNYIAQINQKAELIQGTKNGYQVKSVPAARSYLQQQETLPSNFQERSLFYLKRWLIDREYLSVEELAEQLFISESTFKNDLKLMNSVYAPYQLNFNIQRNYPQVNGSEAARRQLINQLLINEEMLNNTADFDWQDLTNLLTQAFHEQHASLNDIMLNFVTKRLFTILRRVREGKISEQNTETGNFRLLEKDIAASIEKSILENYAITLTAAEREELCYLVSISLEKPNLLEDRELEEKLKEIMEAASTRYQLTLNQESLVKALTFHVEKLLKRGRIGLKIDNPFEAAIAQQDPLLHEVELFIIDALNQVYDMNLEQLDRGFIVLHIAPYVSNQPAAKKTIQTALIFPKYLDYQEKMLQQIQREFQGKLQITHSGPRLTEDMIPTTELILSPYSYEEETIPSCRVSFVLTEQEKSEIWRFIRSFEKRREEAFPFFKTQRILKEKGELTKQEAMQKLCGLCLKEGLISEEFVTSVNKREQLYPTSNQTFAMPHALDVNGTEDTLALLFSAKGILWENELVHLVVLPIFSSSQSFTRYYPLLWQTFAKATCSPVFLQNPTLENLHYLP